MAFVAGALTARASVGTRKWQRSLKRMTSAVQEMSSKTRSAFSKIGTAIKVATTPLRIAGNLAKASAIPIAGMAASMGFAIKKADDYHKALGNVDSLLVGSSMRMENLSAAILRMNPALGSSTELMKSLYGAISAGADTTEKALSMVESAATLSKAVLIENATAVDVLTTSVAAFRRTGMTAKRASDILTTVIRLGKTTGPELAASFGRAAGVFANMGLSMEELAASTALMTRTQKTSEAITQLRALMNGFNSKPMIKALNQVGIASGDVLLKTEGLAGGLEFLKETTGLAQKELRDLLGSQEAVDAVYAILIDGTEGYTKALEAMKNSSGSAFRAMGRQRETFQTLRNSVEGLATEIGTLLLPMADLIAMDITENVQNFRDWLKSAEGLDAISVVVEKIATAFLAVSSAIEAAGGVFLDRLKEKLLGTSSALQSLGSDSGIAFIMINAVASAMGVVVSISSALGLLFDKLSNKDIHKERTAEIESNFQMGKARVEEDARQEIQAQGLVTSSDWEKGKKTIILELQKAFVSRDIERQNALQEELRELGAEYQASINEIARIENNKSVVIANLEQVRKDDLDEENERWKALKNLRWKAIPRQAMAEGAAAKREIEQTASTLLFEKLPEYSKNMREFMGSLTGVGGGRSPEGPSGGNEGNEGEDEEEEPQVEPTLPFVGSRVDQERLSQEFAKPFELPEMKSADTRAGELAAVREHYDLLFILAGNNATRTLELTKDLAEKEKAIRERYRQQYVEGVSNAINEIQTGFSIASSALTSLSQIANSELETQMNTLRSKRASDIAQVRADYAERLKLAKGDKVAQKKILEEQKADEKKVNDEYADQEDKIRKKHFESTKALRISEVIMSTGQAIMSAWQSSAALGPIGGPIAAGLLTGLILFAFEKRMRQIKEQEYVSARALGGMASGLTRVNERGGEIITLPDRSQVIPHDISRQIARNTFKDEPIVINVNLDGATFSSDVDVETIGETVADVLRERRIGT